MKPRGDSLNTARTRCQRLNADRFGMSLCGSSLLPILSAVEDDGHWRRQLQRQSGRKRQRLEGEMSATRDAGRDQAVDNATADN